MTTEAHAIYSPSSAYRNLNCEGSIALIKKTGAKSKTSVFAKEGTEAHDWASKALNVIHSMKHYDFSEIPDEEMRAHVLQYCAFIGEINKNFRITHDAVNYFIERRVTYDGTFFGTADYVLTGYNKKTLMLEAVFCDFKYGKGVEVSAENNAQILCYILCLQKDMDKEFDSVSCFIYQPRTGGDPFTKWEIDQEIIKNVGYVILNNKKECLALLEKDNFTLENIEKRLTAGEWCRFCPGKMRCPAYKIDLNASALKVLDETPEIPDISDLSLDQKIEIFKRRKRIKELLKEVASDLLTTAVSGTKVRDHKMVMGTRRRKWKKDTSGESLTALGVENPYKTSLIGIGEVEKQIGKGKIDDLTELSQPSYQLVLDTDKRLGIEMIGLEELGEIDIEEI